MVRTKTEDIEDSLAMVLRSKNENLEKLRDITSDIMKLTMHFGGVPKAVTKSQIMGTCERCNQEFFVVSRVGELVCPHCKNPKVKWVWGNLQIAFVPEPGGEFSRE